MLINIFSLCFLLLTGINQGLQIKYYYEHYGALILNRSFLPALSVIIANVLLLSLPKQITYLSDVTTLSLSHVIILCSFTIISTLSASIVFLHKTKLFQTAFPGVKLTHANKILLYPLLALLLILPMQFYINPSLFGWPGLSQQSNMLPYGLQWALCYDLGLLSALIFIVITNLFTDSVDEKKKVSKLLSSGLLWLVFAIAGYELAALIATASDFPPQSPERICVDACFTALFFIELILLTRTVR